MSKYYRVEDIEMLVVFSGICDGKTCGEVSNALQSLSTIDIVHCWECKQSKPNAEGDYDCKAHIPIFRVPENGWCYLGERKGDE